MPENILYALQFGSHAGIMRLIMTPFFHAATAAMVGYFVIASKLDGRSKLNIVWALLAVIGLHALYDFGLLSQIPGWVMLSLMIAIGATGSLFILYQRANEADQAVGLSSTGHNEFCRHCGQPNPKHDLYCTHCGQRA